MLTAGIDAQGSKETASVWFSTPIVANGRWLISNVGEFSRFAPPAPTIVYPFAPGFIVEWRKPQVRLSECTQSIINTSVHVHYITMLFNGIDCRQNAHVAGHFDKVRPAEYLTSLPW